jgi:hypothetical protein
MKPIETGVLDDAVAGYMVSWTQMFSVRSQAFHISVRARGEDGIAFLEWGDDGTMLQSGASDR